MLNSETDKQYEIKYHHDTGKVIPNFDLIPNNIPEYEEDIDKYFLSIIDYVEWLEDQVEV